MVNGGNEHWNNAVREALDGNAWEVRGTLWQMAGICRAYMHQTDAEFPGVVRGKRLSEDAEEYVPLRDPFDEATGYKQEGLVTRAVELENEVDRLRSVVASLEEKLARWKAYADRLAQEATNE